MKRHSLDALNYFFLLSLTSPQTRYDDKLMSSSTMWPFATYTKSSSCIFWINIMLYVNYISIRLGVGETA